MHLLQGKSLKNLQEDFKHIKYILIDEMSFLGPKLSIKIDKCLREAFPQRQQEPFGGVSIVLVGDLGQLPPVFDKPIYASSSTTIMLCKTFNIVITLDTIFCQQGQSQSQHQFQEILHNIRNVEALQDD